jgi:hypothetical protein
MLVLNSYHGYRCRLPKEAASLEFVTLQGDYH